MHVHATQATARGIDSSVRKHAVDARTMPQRRKTDDQTRTWRHGIHLWVGHRRSKPRSVERPPEGGHHTHHCTLRPDPRRRQTRAARAVSVNRQSAGTSPSRLALSAEVPGDFPQSWGLRVCGPPCVCSGGVSRPCPTCSGDASSGEFVEELEGPRRVKNFGRSSAHRLERAQQFCELDHVEAHPLGGAQEVARVTSGGASACERAATRPWLAR